jgi:hypothetical protein
MDQLGFADWDTAVSTFAGLSKEDVLDLLDETITNTMRPHFSKPLIVCLYSTSCDRGRG